MSNKSFNSTHLILTFSIRCNVSNILFVYLLLYHSSVLWLCTIMDHKNIELSRLEKISFIKLFLKKEKFTLFSSILITKNVFKIQITINEFRCHFNGQRKCHFCNKITPKFKVQMGEIQWKSIITSF